MVRAGQAAIAAILEEDVTRLCGGRHERRGAGSPMRWGDQGGAVVLGGRWVKVTRPRVRQSGREVELPSYAQFQREDPLEERAMTQMLCGVSTRKYERSLESAKGFDNFGTSKSAVSRRFVALSKKRPEGLMSTSSLLLFPSGIESNVQRQERRAGATRRQFSARIQDHFSIKTAVRVGGQIREDWPLRRRAQGADLRHRQALGIYARGSAILKLGAKLHRETETTPLDLVAGAGPGASARRAARRSTSR